MSEYIDTVRLNGSGIPIRDSDAQQKIAHLSQISTGNGISSAVMNNDGTLTLNFTDGTSFTTENIRGLPGQGVPAGGAAGKYLRKQTGTDYDTEWGSLPKAVTVDFGTVSSLPATKSAAGVTADMAAVAYEFGTPSAFTSALTVTTGSGTVTLSGTISGSSTVTVTLVPADAVAGA
ncbi:MAG: hypothetical protein IK099_14335 [Clostridia bacterium]|nr:hypothetical protein [Clostridia bacterium]